MDDILINLFLHKTDEPGNIALTRAFAEDYLKIILWGLLPFCLAQVFSLTLRETGETVAPMVAGFLAVLTNCCLNYLLIFGKFGCPKLGVEGAAIATVISRYVELAVIAIYTFSHKKRFPYINGAFSGFTMPKKLFRDITLKGMPLMINEFLWAGGMMLLSVGYSLHGIAVVAGYSISSTVMNLANIAFISLGSSIGIIVGRQLGAGKFAEAEDTDRKLIAFSVAISVLVGIGMLLAGGEITRLYNTTVESKQYAEYFIRVCACFIPVSAFANASYFTLRSGGKTLVTFLFDSVFVICVSVPIAFSLYYLFHLSVWVIFPIVQSLEIIKDIIGFILIRKKVWINNIVE